MGAGPSTERDSDASAASPVRTSYYELLEVEKQATQDEIKKAYRRKALELHPDRNYGDVERATTLFAEIQTAYEVLSDPQERQWYDSHEDAILRGADETTTNGDSYESSTGITTADEIAAMMSRFTGRTEFTDAPSGFFGFLRETFEKIAKEELRSSRERDAEQIDYASFGHKDDSYDEVVKQFYASWSGFSTRKTFSWRDKYDTRGTDRYTRRLAEKENKRFRDEGIRDFNDAVRNLVLFVRKRDPRYTPNMQTDEERQRVLRDAASLQATRMRAANEAKINAEVLPEWVTNREDDDLPAEEFEEEVIEEFECVACNKTFKSERQLDAHEKSKKHQKAVKDLKRRLLKDGISIDTGDHENAPPAVQSHADDDNSVEQDMDTVESKTATLDL